MSCSANMATLANKLNILCSFASAKKVKPFSSCVFLKMSDDLLHSVQRDWESLLAACCVVAPLPVHATTIWSRNVLAFWLDFRQNYGSIQVLRQHRKIPSSEDALGWNIHKYDSHLYAYDKLEHLYQYTTKGLGKYRIPQFKLLALRSCSMVYNSNL